VEDPAVERQAAVGAGNDVKLQVRKTFEAERVRSVLVRGPNWVGDALLTLPTLVNVRGVFPSARISLLVHGDVAGLFTDVPTIDEVLELPRRRQLGWAATALRKRDFELALLLPNSFKAALLCALAAIPHRVGYATDGRWLLLTVGIAPPPRGSLHQADYYLGLLRALSWDTWERPDGLVISPRGDGEVGRLLARFGLRPDRPLVGVSPGAAYGTAKRWPTERFAEAADRLAGRWGATVLLFGSVAEADVTARVRGGMRGPAIDLAGKTSIGTFATLLRRCRVLLTNDTGAMHLAATLGVPCVALFGPTDPRLTGPRGSRHQVLHVPPPCSPCRYRDCPIDHRCMLAIGVEEAVAAAERLVAARVSTQPANGTRQRAIFLDRDGTINEEVGPLQSPELMRPVPGAAAALKRLGEAGFLRIVVSNQSRVARGDATEELVQATHRQLLALLNRQGGSTDAFYYCPHHPTEGRFPYKRACRCRKPEPGLIHLAAREHDVDVSRSYVIGDQLADLALGRRLGIPSVLVLTGFGRETLRRVGEGDAPMPDHVATDLQDAANWVLAKGGSA
jgi:heptosyltransferase-2